MNIYGGAMRIMAVLVAAVLLAGCGGDDGGQVAFDPEAPDAPSGSAESIPSPFEPAPEGAPPGLDLPVMDDPFAEVEAMMDDSGIIICAIDGGSGDISGSYDSESYRFGTADEPCGDPGDPDWGGTPGSVSVHLYNEPSTAGDNLYEPIGDAYWTWLLDPTTVARTHQGVTPGSIEVLQEMFADYPVAGPHL